MVAVILVVLVVLPAASSTTLDHAHDFDKELEFSCPDNNMISKVNSEFSDAHKDRQWAFGCSYVPAGASLTHCSWSGYVNSFKEPAIYQCHGGGVMTGWASYHSQKPTEDRRTKYQCCKPSEGYLTHSCHYTGFLNYFTEHVSYRVPDGWVITGVFSYFSSDHKDRRYIFNICALDMSA